MSYQEHRITLAIMIAGVIAISLSCGSGQTTDSGSAVESMHPLAQAELAFVGGHTRQQIKQPVSLEIRRPPDSSTARAVCAGC